MGAVFAVVGWCMAFLDNPGVSFVAFDPGGTTGVAVYDAYTGELYVDQIDAGRGRKVRLNVWPHKKESLVKNRTRKQMDKEGVHVAGGGTLSQAELSHRLEAGVAQVMLDITMAAGPRTIIVIEDFILGWGDPNKVASSAREGLSPVRLLCRYRQKCEDMGIFNGDAWRDWDGFGALGQDKRGIKVVRSSLGEPMDFQQRLSDVERWRLGERTEDVNGWRGLWAGDGAKWVQRLPGQRYWLPGGMGNGVTRGGSGYDGTGNVRSGNAAIHKEWLKARGQWRATCPHAMDALLHMQAVARSIGCEVPGDPRRIWASGETMKKSRVTTKAGIPAHRLPGV